MSFLTFKTPSVIFLFLVFLFIQSCRKNNFNYFEEGKKDVNGTSLYYKSMGDGEPVIILHGGPGLEQTYLLPQMGKLAEKFKLIFYDQRGTGHSEEQVDSSSFTVENFVDDLEGIRKSFGLTRMNILGHSWGGLLGLLYAIKYPQNVKSLMLISTAPGRSDFWEEWRNIRNSRIPKEDSIAIDALRNSEDFKNKKIETYEKFYKIFFKSYFYNQQDGESLTIKFTQTTLNNRPLVAPLYGYLNNYNILNQLSGINCPTLIVHGDADPIPLSYIEELNKFISKSELHIIKNCGHFPYIETPDKLFGLISDFMEGHK